MFSIRVRSPPTRSYVDPSYTYQRLYLIMRLVLDSLPPEVVLSQLCWSNRSSLIAIRIIKQWTRSVSDDEKVGQTER